MSVSYLARLSPSQPPTRCSGFITDLLLRCAQEDHSAMGRLFDVLHPLVQAMVSGGARTTPPDDVVVEVFRRLWCESPAFDPTAQAAIDWVLDQARIVVGPRAVHTTALIA